MAPIQLCLSFAYRFGLSANYATQFANVLPSNKAKLQKKNDKVKRYNFTTYQHHNINHFVSFVV